MRDFFGYFLDISSPILLEKSENIPPQKNCIFSYIKNGKNIQTITQKKIQKKQNISLKSPPKSPDFSAVHKIFLSTYARRASCSYVWNTPEGGPCILRPVPPGCPGNPAWDDPDTNGYLANSCSANTDKITGEITHSSVCTILYEISI